MSTEVAKAKNTEVSADLMDDIFDNAGEGAYILNTAEIKRK